MEIYIMGCSLMIIGINYFIHEKIKEGSMLLATSLIFILAHFFFKFIGIGD